MKKIILSAIILAIAVAIGRTIGTGIGKNMEIKPKDDSSRIEMALKEEIKKMNFPIMVDQYSRVDSAEVANKTIKYRVTMIGVKDAHINELKPELDKYFFSNNVKNICENKSSRAVLEKDFYYNYEVFTETKKRIASYIVGKQHCTK